MQPNGSRTGRLALATLLILATSALGAQASSHHTRHAHARTTQGFQRIAYHPHRTYGRVIQCVAFARADSDVALSGNARDWWSNARGIYARGHAPEIGSVLSFAPTLRMRLGHVAVVSAVRDSRVIEIDQSHWASGGVSRQVRVVDVSDNNDWTAVRVQMGRTGPFGSIYPTHGFIYPRPAAGSDPAPRLIEASVDATSEEVAEAPAGHAIDLTLPGIATDAPNRSLR